MPIDTLDSSTSSSSDREPTPPTTTTTNKKKKKVIVGSSDGKGKYEGVSQHPEWAYTPPAGVVLLQDTVDDAGEFDWDEVAGDEDVEVWVVRVPESVKPRYLEDVRLDVQGLGKGNGRVGVLRRKHATFDIWSVGEGEGGGEEIKSLECLLPRKSRNGKLYPAPRPIARHLVVSAQPVVPASSTSTTMPHAGPARERYPREALRHAFRPYGSFGGAREEVEKASPRKKGKAKAREDAMDVDVAPAEKEKRKRKGDGVEGTSKPKTKKVKTS